jgi:transcriptional regulator with XRE-family HTH domain
MVGVEAALEIRVLHRHGKSIREIARETGVARNTVRRYLRDEAAARYKPRPPRSTKLDPFKAYVAERLGSAAPEWIPASVLLMELRERGYCGGYTMLKLFVASHRDQNRQAAEGANTAVEVRDRSIIVIVVVPHPRDDARLRIAGELHAPPILEGERVECQPRCHLHILKTGCRQLIANLLRRDRRRPQIELDIRGLRRRVKTDRTRRYGCHDTGNHQGLVHVDLPSNPIASARARTGRSAMRSFRRPFKAVCNSTSRRLNSCLLTEMFIPR